MRLWVPIAVASVVGAAYLVFYLTSGNFGGSPFGLVNAVGLVAVFLCLVGAGLIIRRAQPHQ